MCVEQEHKLRSKNTNPEIKKNKNKNTIPDTRKKKKKTPTHTHFLSFAQTHAKKQHPNLKCNNTNNASLSLCLSLLSKMSSQQWQQKPRTQIQSKSHKPKHKISSISTHPAMVELKQKILGITS